jgi:hypothetical protein
MPERQVVYQSGNVIIGLDPATSQATKENRCAQAKLKWDEIIPKRNARVARAVAPLPLGKGDIE